jgi:hypothetical protein
MRLAICTIVHNRGLRLREWVGFHYLVGFRKFFIYVLQTSDSTFGEIQRLQVHFDIEAVQVSGNFNEVRLPVYAHVYEKHNHRFDWIAFLDCNEFLFGPDRVDLREILERFAYQRLSAVAVYRVCFGSLATAASPDNLLIDTFRHKAKGDSDLVRSVKSLVFGRQGSNFSTIQQPYIFNTIHGTVTESFIPVSIAAPLPPASYSTLRINWYPCDDPSQFLFHQLGATLGESLAWSVTASELWNALDRNEEFDFSLIHLSPKLKEMLSLLAKQV